MSPAERERVAEPSRLLWLTVIAFGITAVRLGAKEFGAGYQPLHWSLTPTQDFVGGLVWSVWIPVVAIGGVALGPSRPVLGGLLTGAGLFAGALATFFAWSNDCAFGGSCNGRTFVAAGVCVSFAAAVLGAWGLHGRLHRRGRTTPGFERNLMATFVALGSLGIGAALWNPTDLLYWQRGDGLGIAYFALVAVLGPRLAYLVETTPAIRRLCAVTWCMLAPIGLLTIPFLFSGAENVESAADCTDAGVCVVGVARFGGMLVEFDGGRLELRSGSGPLTRSVVIHDSWRGEDFEFVTDSELRVGTDCQETIEIDPADLSARTSDGSDC